MFVICRVHCKISDRGECVRALACAGDRYLLEVSRKGWLTVWDMGTMVQLKHKRIVSEAEEVKSLTVLEEQQSIDSITIVLVVDNHMNGNTEASSILVEFVDYQLCGQDHRLVHKIGICHSQKAV